ncbi:MAG: hypothetical protein NDJ75_11950, partial [Thermoanaerobaculia bacterium]|nr:hypothetical protein [Thermoanaerobaculia bacterium]
PPGRIAADRLPSFGPWSLPPARELVVAQRGEELAVVLAVYPTVALVARASGRLAGNPWLAGGDVELGRGRAARVTWTEGRWRLASVLRARAPEAAAGAAGNGSRDGTIRRDALARLRLGRDVGRWPAGSYRVERGGDGLAVLGGRAPAAALPPLGADASRPAAWLVERTGRRVGGTVIWRQPGPMPPFPAALTLDRGRAGRRRVPGEELLRMAGGEPQRTQADGFQLRALSAREIDLGRPLAAELAALLAARRGLAVFAGARPDGLAEASRRLSDRLAGLPLGRLLGVSPERVTALLAPLGGCAATVLEVWSEPRAVRWRLCVDEAPAPAAAAPPAR